MSDATQRDESERMKERAKAIRCVFMSSLLASKAKPQAL